MDELTRRNNAATDRFLASLTDHQRALIRVKGISADKLQLTPYQQSLAAETKVPEEMNVDQAWDYGTQCTIEENRERFQEGFKRGWEEGDRRAKRLIWIAGTLGVCIAILILLRC
jgi:hypothetical protein